MKQSLFRTVTAIAAAAYSFGQTPALQDVNLAYGLTASSLLQVDVAGDLGQTVTAAVEIDGRQQRLILAPKSVRAPGFKLLKQIEDGSLVSVDPGPVSTYAGVVEGMPGAQVVGGLQDAGLFAKLIMPDGRMLWLQPVLREFPQASTRDYVLYDNADIIPDGVAHCGVEGMSSMAPSQPGGTYVNQLGTLEVAEIACDADFEYFQDYGSVNNTSNRIQNVLGTMNNQYESQVNLTHEITEIIVRTTSNDPYSSNDASTLLGQFRSHWNSQQGGVQRDIAHLFTGKNIQNGTIGIAYLGVICNQGFGYGLVESDFNNNFGCATDLSAHELGHNWDGDHCSCNNFTMNPFITCANNFNNFSINQITAFAATRNCLDTGAGCTDDNLENNDTCNQATVIGQGITAGLKSSNSDNDYFSIQLGPFDSLTIDALFSHAQGDVDIELFNNNCSTLLDESDSGTNNESVLYTNPNGTNQTVKLRVFQFNGNGCTDYSLDVDIQAGDPCTGPDDAFEPNDSCAAPAMVGNLSFASAYVEKTDVDFYEVCVSNGDTLSVQAFFNHSAGDVDLRLYSAGCGGAPLASSLTTSNSELITWTNNTGGGQTYVLEARIDASSASDCNTYVLEVSGAGGNCGGGGVPLGSNYCPANANSTGQTGLITGFGSDVASDNDVTLTASQLPTNKTGYFLASMNQTFVANAGGSQGNLCIGSGSARFLNQIGNSGASGTISIMVNTSSVPTTPPQPILAGQTWNFQLWHRDNIPASTSNFTNALEIPFQ